MEHGHDYCQGSPLRSTFLRSCFSDKLLKVILRYHRPITQRARAVSTTYRERSDRMLTVKVA
jgi:hypothetical protein